VKAARGVHDLRAALRLILARAALKLSPDGGSLSAHFELAGQDVEAGKLPRVVAAGWRLDDIEAPPLVTLISRRGIVAGQIQEEPHTTSWRSGRPSWTATGPVSSACRRILQVRLR
jgi:hypothetical protein